MPFKGFVFVKANNNQSNAPVCGGTYYTTNCKADNSLSIVKADCQDKPNCVLKADNGKFGDPCVGTKKYLEVSDIHRLMKFTFQH